MPKKKKRIEVHWYRRRTGLHEHVATFEIEGDKVETDWKDPTFEEIMTEQGIVAEEKVLRPKDGVEFAENLELAFSNSTSFLVVVK
jgi:hypothetical protein